VGFQPNNRDTKKTKRELATMIVTETDDEESMKRKRSDNQQAKCRFGTITRTIHGMASYNFPTLSILTYQMKYLSLKDNIT